MSCPSGWGRPRYQGCLCRSVRSPSISPRDTCGHLVTTPNVCYVQLFVICLQKSSTRQLAAAPLVTENDARYVGGPVVTACRQACTECLTKQSCQSVRLSDWSRAPPTCTVNLKRFQSVFKRASHEWADKKAVGLKWPSIVDIITARERSMLSHVLRVPAEMTLHR